MSMSDFPWTGGGELVLASSVTLGLLLRSQLPAGWGQGEARLQVTSCDLQCTFALPGSAQPQLKPVHKMGHVLSCVCLSLSPSKWGEGWGFHHPVPLRVIEGRPDNSLPPENRQLQASQGQSCGL